MDIEVLLFYIFSSLALVSGGLVVSARNPMHSILFLVLVFCNSAGLLLLLETEFLAMLFLIVYVGAIAILFLFVVMMLNVRITELKESILRYIPVGGLILIIFLFEVLLTFDWCLIRLSSVSTLNSINQIFLSYPELNLVVWTNNINPVTNIEAIGELLFTYYFYAFFMASMILLVAMIGAILLTMRKQYNVRRQEVFDQTFNNFNTSVPLVK